ncbi:MAG: GGDEF domain-containing protein [Anaerovoracaceae bacterium]
MDYYFLVITIIDVFVLAIMCILTKCNDTLNKNSRRWFISSFILIIAISILEVITVVVDGGPGSLRWINIIANYLGFGLTPAVSIFLASALEKNRSTRYAIIFQAVFLLLLAITFPWKIIFYIDQNNQYMRGDLFGIYITVYSASILYLLATTIRVARLYQNKSKNSVYPIAVFLLAGTMIQVVFPKIHVTWLCVSLLAILFFTYCNGMWQQLDGLTGLLNQSSYLNKTDSLSQNGTLIVFDIDDFKLINDNYGHLLGDKCLEEIAACIKKAYSKEGFCYRIGGDEFCVLLNEKADAEACYMNLINEMEIKRKTIDVLPYVSIGSAQFEAGDNILKIKETADKNMYQFKKKQKAARQSAIEL